MKIAVPVRDVPDTWVTPRPPRTGGTIIADEG